MQKRFQLTAAALAGTLALAPLSSASAAGFSISARGTSNLGNAFSGTAAEVEDASVVYNNPAGMQKLDGTHTSLTLHVIAPKASYTHEADGEEYEADDDIRYVPNLYYVQELNPDTRLGLAVYSPWGLGLDWGDSWPGNTYSIKSEMKTVTVSPSLSFQATPNFSIGASIDFQYLDAKLSKALSIGGTNELTADNWAHGFSLGVLYDADETTRFGATLHSAIRHDLSGKAKFSGYDPTIVVVPALGLTAGDIFANTTGKVTLHLPETLSLSVAHDYSRRLTVMADYTYTRWSRYEELTVVHDSPLGTVSEEKNWKDTARVSLGINYLMSPKWLLRMGYAFDESPVPDDTRDPRVPDGDRDWLTIGFNFRASEDVSIDAAYAYLHMDEEPSELAGLDGDYENGTQYASIQLNWKLK